MVWKILVWQTKQSKLPCFIDRYMQGANLIGPSQKKLLKRLDNIGSVCKVFASPALLQEGIKIWLPSSIKDTYKRMCTFCWKDNHQLKYVQVLYQYIGCNLGIWYWYEYWYKRRNQSGMTWSNTSLIPVVVWYETWDVPGLYLPQNHVHTVIHQAKISLGPNTSTQLVSFWNVPNTSTSQVWKKKKAALDTRTSWVCSKVDTSTTLVCTYVIVGGHTLYLFPCPPIPPSKHVNAGHVWSGQNKR
jgi:hypothetical protein